MTTDGNKSTDPAERGTPIRGRMSYTMRRRLRSVGLYCAVGAIVFVVASPLYWMVTSSIREPHTILTREPPLVSTDVTFDHYRLLLFHSPFVDVYLVNSIVVALGVVALTTTLATLGGYGLTRIDVPYKETFTRGILFGYMFPSVLLALPMYVFWRELGLINSYVGLILAETALALPFSLWLMWKYFRTVPRSLEESARIGGASRIRAFYDVALPMAKPGITAVAVFAFAISWTEFTMPKVLTSDPDMYVITVGLESFVLQHNVLWGQTMAASVITLIPALLFVAVLQRYLIRGFRSGGVK